MSNYYTLKKAAGIFSVSLIVTGCASVSDPNTNTSTWDTKRVLCVAAGGLAGAALDAASNSGSNGGSKAGGVIIGAGLGAIFCSEGVVFDGDKDGVIDKNDQCPYTPSGLEVDAVGCALDEDNDGVPNSIDQCLNTPAGAEVDETGCQLFKDDDGDGVENSIDQCPDTPAGVSVNAIGCDEGAAIVLDGVFFEYKSSDLTNSSKLLLDQVADKLVAAQVDVLVGGHTDSIGGNKYNLTLSRERADSVKNYLVSQGVDEFKIMSKGFGEGNPLADNKTDEGRAENRRVDMQVQN
jgi:OOP family OmpA-OmpF porin